MDNFNRLWRADVLLFVSCILVFVCFPWIDVYVSSWFFQEGEFYLADHVLVYGLYVIFAKIHFVMLFLLLASLVYLYRVSKTDLTKTLLLKRVRFSLLALILVPGLLINTVVKDNSIGRARPIQVHEFGGEQRFTAAFEPAGQCRRNCSFVSGHAAMGFYFMIFGWVFGSRRVWQLALGLGFAVGFGRILQGGHFLSDVVFSFWFSYWSLLAMVKYRGYSLSVRPAVLKIH